MKQRRNKRKCGFAPTPGRIVLATLFFMGSIPAAGSVYGTPDESAAEVDPENSEAPATAVKAEPDVGTGEQDADRPATPTPSRNDVRPAREKPTPVKRDQGSAGKISSIAGDGDPKERSGKTIAKKKFLAVKSEEAKKKSASKRTVAQKDDSGFAFGSYGRVGAATDGHGSTTKPINVVSHGTRLEEATYLELDLYYKMRPFDGVVLQTVTTLGFKEDLFHYSADSSSA